MGLGASLPTFALIMNSIKRWVLATFILTFLVVIAGGVVRTTQSGMGCPDWPKCFGKWIPPTNASELPPDFEKYLRKQDIDHTFNALHTWIEYFNRLLGALLGLFAVIQTFVLFRKRNLYPKSFRLAIAFFALVVATGLFGAIVVKLNLAHLSISVHLLFAIVMLQVQLALLLSLDSRLFSIPVNKSTKRLLLVFLIVLLTQVVLGTMLRMYVDDVSKILHYEQRQTWLASMPVEFLLHRSFSWFVLAAVLFLSWYCRNNDTIKNKIFMLLSIVILNMIVGITLFYADMPAVAQPVHLLLATAAITQTMAILLQIKAKGFLPQRP